MVISYETILLVLVPSAFVAWVVGATWRTWHVKKRLERALGRSDTRVLRASGRSSSSSG